VNRPLFLKLLYNHLALVGILTGLFLLASYALRRSSYRPGLLAGILVLTALALVFISTLMMSRLLNRSATEIEHACDRLGSGQFDFQLTLKRPDELTDLTDAFNQMATSINQVVTNLREKDRLLTRILDSLHEGLLVLDPAGRVIVANETFKRIVGATAVEGKFYWEVMREPRLGDMLQRLSAATPTSTREIELTSRTFICSASLLPDSRETVLTFHDVTEIIQAARIKREIVLNVSHELRTPLAAIKGYVETLAETIDDEGNRHYLEIIRRHTDRLANLAQDLLELSQLEDKTFELQLEDVDLRTVAANAVAVYERPAKAKGLKLQLHSADNLPTIKADPFRLEQALINLLDNAVKYTETGSITVSLEHHDGHVVIIVQDTGIGIAKEHLSKLFERFYVVDKSRSRRLGSTGLGLSIVKHIALLHNGDVAVESTPGLGSRFTIRLPVT